MRKLLDVVNEAIGKELDKEIYKLSANENLLDVGMNSIKFMTMIIALETAYNIIIDDEGMYIENLATLNSIKKYLENKMGKEIEW